MGRGQRTANQNVRRAYGAPRAGNQIQSRRNRLVTFDEIGFKLWDVASGKELAAAAGDYGDGDDIHFSPQGNFLAAITNDGVTLWSTETGKVIRVLPGVAHSFSFSSNGNVLVASEFMKQVNLWDVASGKQIVAIHPSVKDSKDVWLMWSVFSPDSRTLAVSEYDTNTFTAQVLPSRCENGQIASHHYMPKEL